LVEFTGNKSIMPMLQQASSLGLSGLVWIVVVKVAAISWSKAVGYRGGMIFPIIFIAAVLVAIVQLYVPGFNFIYGLIAAIIGALVANRRTHVLV
jgi:H+/Cl- antiporter ClcA